MRLQGRDGLAIHRRRNQPELIALLWRPLGERRIHIQTSAGSPVGCQLHVDVINHTGLTGARVFILGDQDIDGSGQEICLRLGQIKPVRFALLLRQRLRPRGGLAQRDRKSLVNQAQPGTGQTGKNDCSSMNHSALLLAVSPGPTGADCIPSLPRRQ